MFNPVKMDEMRCIAALLYIGIDLSFFGGALSIRECEDGSIIICENGGEEEVYKPPSKSRAIDEFFRRRQKLQLGIDIEKQLIEEKKKNDQNI